MLPSQKVGTDQEVTQSKRHTGAKTKICSVNRFSTLYQKKVLLTYYHSEQGVCHTRDSHRFLPLLDYHAVLAAEGLGIIEIIARLKNRCIYHIGIHYIFTTSKIY